MSYSTQKMNKQYTVCANHFEDNQFMNPAMKNRLIHNAVPTIFDIPNPPPNYTKNLNTFSVFCLPLYITLNYWFTDHHQGCCKQGLLHMNI